MTGKSDVMQSMGSQSWTRLSNRFGKSYHFYVPGMDKAPKLQGNFLKAVTVCCDDMKGTDCQSWEATNS